MFEDHLNINELKQAYARNENITKLLSEKDELERQEIIEIAYDIQTGSYTKGALTNPERLRRYAKEIQELCKDLIFAHDTILDCGAGELTTLSALSQHLPEHTHLLACDISLSRLHVGRRFAERVMRGDLALTLKLFVADMGCMPLADRSVDVIFTSHAEVTNQGSRQESAAHPFQCPRSGFLLQRRLNYWWSEEGGWAYPEIEGISLLRTKHGVLMSHG